MNYLDDVPEDKAFILGDKKIRNLYGLLFELRSMDDELFSHYSSKHHNYFADWIEHILINNNISSGLREKHSRQETIDYLEGFINPKANLPQEPAADEQPEEEPVAAAETQEAAQKT
ncbi:hypothetical protein JXC34_04860, partial [Candidatus Woesearchaeota archaeon]|nr:hypothetical protein [Candidatus Woesearchaeota archaeon]